MSMLRDKIGNEVKVGDWVNVEIVAHTIICKVMSIKDPSPIAIPQQHRGGVGTPDTMIMPGEIVLVSEHHIPFDMRLPIADMVVVRIPKDAPMPATVYGKA